MSENIYDEIATYAKELHINIDEKEVANYAKENNLNQESLDSIDGFLGYVSDKHNETIIQTCLRLSKLPLKEPKTFKNYDFTRIRGDDVEQLKNLSTLSQLYSNTNIALIGPQGVGKTHLSQAFGRECCLRKFKTYFLKASELNDRLTLARETGKVPRVINGLVKPSCLIIDEIGRCKFDSENTRLLFDIIDRRSNKEGPNCMIFTSNRNPSDWNQWFDERDALLGAMDRFFDRSEVFLIDGTSYRGKNTKTYSLEAGEITR